MEKQTSNILPPIAIPGIYTVVVSNACGQELTQGITIKSTTGRYFLPGNNSYGGFSILKNCNTIQHEESLQYFNSDNNRVDIPDYKYPINVKIEIDNPTGGPNTIIEEVWETPGPHPVDIPYYPSDNGSYNYNITLTDSCGDTFTRTESISRGINYTATVRPALCGTSYVELSNFVHFMQDTEIEFIEYPPGFNPSSINTLFEPGSYKAIYKDKLIPSNILRFGQADRAGFPPGTYKIRVTTSCGQTLTKEFTITNYNYTLNNNVNYSGCGNSEGYLSIQIGTDQGSTTLKADDLEAITIISAPQTFITKYGALPYNASYNISSDGVFRMNSLPEGTYIFEGKGKCGINITSKPIIIEPINIVSKISTTYNCGSFNVEAELKSRLNNDEMFLQKYYPAQGKWGHPITGILYEEGTTILNTQGMSMNTPRASQAYHTTIGRLTNLTSTGEFRVIVQSRIGSNGNIQTLYCQYELETFKIGNNFITLLDYYVVTCADNTYNLIIDAEGSPPLKYVIIEKNGVDVNIDNGNDPVFVGLTQGNYKVRITDNCGNSIIINVRVVQNKLPRILVTKNLCEGEDGYLYVDGLAFLTIRWFKDGIDTGVRGNRYNFTKFDFTKDSGKYSAVLTYEPNTNDCINNTLEFNLDTESLNDPSPGIGQTVTINASTTPGPINLFDYLDGNPYEHGNWTEITVPSSNLLTDNYWYSMFADTGTYVFRYTVDGLCSGTSFTDVTINYVSSCTQTGDFSIPGTQTQTGITLQQKQSGWPENIPNGFIALESQTKGFVITRVQNSSAIVEPKPGMLIYDIDAACVKLYNSIGWNCINKSCNN